MPNHYQPSANGILMAQYEPNKTSFLIMDFCLQGEDNLSTTDPNVRGSYYLLLLLIVIVVVLMFKVDLSMIFKKTTASMDIFINYYCNKLDLCLKRELTALNELGIASKI